MSDFLPGYDEWLERPYEEEGREKKEKPERDPDYERDLKLDRKYDREHNEDGGRKMEGKGYVYIRIIQALYTVGFYDQKGKWQSESDHPNKEKAAERVHWLNGGMVGETVVKESSVESKHWGPDDDYLVVGEFQVFEEEGFHAGQRVRVTVEKL
jgi:hypothetical protein